MMPVSSGASAVLTPLSGLHINPAATFAFTGRESFLRSSVTTVGPIRLCRGSACFP
jgi:hypothetical protein